MKTTKITLGLLILNILGVTLSSFSQYAPMLKENCEWYTHSWFEISYNETFQIIGDSTINDTTYKKIGSYPTGINPTFYNIHLVREDTITRKIYRRANRMEYLLYDFTLQPGDTFTIKRTDGWFVHDLVLDSISNTLHNITDNFLQTDIENMRVYYFHDPFFAFIDNVVWIEGIGSLAGLLHSDQSWNGGVTGETLLCHYNENSVRDFHYVYYEEPNPCESVVSSIGNIETQNPVKISPNPSTDGLYRIEGQDMKSIEVFNSSGNKVLFLNSAIKDNTAINLSKYPAGMYFMRIVFTNDQSLVHKLIKL